MKGVTIRFRAGAWRARWRENGKQREKVLHGLNAKARAEWARRKARELRNAREHDAEWKQSLERYLEVRPIRESTVVHYRMSISKFIDAVPADLTPQDLFRWSEGLTGAPSTTNGARARVRAFVNWCRKSGLLALTRDEIMDNLAPVRVRRERPDYLSKGEIRELLRACAEHDAALTAGSRKGPPVRKHKVDALPLIRVTLLTGMRRAEVLGLQWSQIEGDVIRLTSATKGGYPRDVDLRVCPSVVTTLGNIRRRGPLVFSGWSPTVARRVIKNLCDLYGAPTVTLQRLRVTCATYLASSVGIWGGAAAHLTAAQLGHSVEVSQRFYAGVIRGLEGSTLEEVFGLD